ncbi:hypothetical protein VUJ46_05105 [Chryseobacterium sp. MYb264]|uniref:hypothetical protein n=1 Tax=Chryseobacterium sp. MYb264 TaxID=2745153 RepID=UPI002E0DA590|nr:hypothetical protein VUJ46_05105 [Chryseobacterium sp. MYb264]
MKKIILLISIILFCSCHSQKKMSLRQMNDYLLKNNKVDFGSLEPIELKGMKDALTKYRLLAAQSCHINFNKKYSQIYIEDGFQDQDAVYNGIIIIDNKDVCEMTTSNYKLKIDSLSYNKIEDGNFVLFTKEISMETFKKKNLNEYFRYELVIQNKTDSLKECLLIDEYTPKPIISTNSYYFLNGKVNSYETIKINYIDIRNGIEGIPYFKEAKKQEFTKCINKLDILKINTSSK